jgi:hypothetical protein
MQVETPLHTKVQAAFFRPNFWLVGEGKWQLWEVAEQWLELHYEEESDTL